MILRASIILGGLLLLSGCTSQFKKIETNTDQAVQGQARMQEQLAEVHDAVSTLQEGEAGREADYLELRAEMESQLRQLDTLIRRMDVRSEQQEELLHEVLAALDLLARQPVPIGLSDSTSTGLSSAGGPVGGSAGKDVYDAAWADYTRGDYALARDGFGEVVDRFGQSTLADDAAYWQAETWYAQRDYEQARDGFDRMIRRYPDSDVMPSAQLKLAYSLLETEETERAISVLQALRESYPDSDEALIAGHKLSTLAPDEDAS